MAASRLLTCHSLGIIADDDMGKRVHLTTKGYVVEFCSFCGNLVGYPILSPALPPPPSLLLGQIRDQLTLSDPLSQQVTVASYAVGGCVEDV